MKCKWQPHFKLLASSISKRTMFSLIQRNSVLSLLQSFIQKNTVILLFNNVLSLAPSKIATGARKATSHPPPSISSTQRALDYFQSVVFMTGINMTCSLWFILKIYFLIFLCLVHRIRKQCDISVVQIYKVYFHTNLLWITIFATSKCLTILFSDLSVLIENYFLWILHVTSPASNLHSLHVPAI